MEPDIELLIVEISSIMRLLLSGCRLAIYQNYGNAIRDAKAFPELSFRQKFGEAPCLRASGAYALSTTFLASTNHAGGSIAPYC